MDREKDIGFEIRRLSNLIKRDVEKSRRRLGIDPVKGVNGWAISYFYENMDNDIFQKDFENHFSIRPSTASKILKTMEQKGYINRVAVESDARLKRIVLTDKAIELHKNVISEISKREKRMRKGLDEKQIQIFFDVMEKLCENMEEEND